MKPSLRRDSLAQKRPGRLGDIEKAAKKAAHEMAHIYGKCNSNYEEQQQKSFFPIILRLLQRHGAKVRRDMVKTGATHIFSQVQLERFQKQAIEDVLENIRRQILAPRGPEKGRRK